MDPRYLNFGYSGLVSPDRRFVPLQPQPARSTEFNCWDLGRPSSALSNDSYGESSSASGSTAGSISPTPNSGGCGLYEPTTDELLKEVLKGKKKSYDRWSRQEEELLVQLWAQYHDGIESREARKYWSKIAEELNKQYPSKLALNKLVEKCQRKMRYLIDKYKNAKDWNRNQSGGHFRKSPHFDVVDSILGTRDIVTFDNVEETEGETDSNSQVRSNTHQDGEQTNPPEVESPKSAATGKDSSRSPATPAQPRKARKKSVKRGIKDVESDDEEEKQAFKAACKSINEQGDKMVDVMKQCLESAQQQQAAMFQQFLGSLSGLLGGGTSK